MQNVARIALGLGAAAVVASTGSAFTAGNTLVGSNVAGHSSLTVAGATTTDIEHTIDSAGQITSTLITFSAVLGADREIKASFNSAALQNCETPDGSSASIVCNYNPTFTATTATQFFVAVS